MIPFQVHECDTVLLRWSYGGHFSAFNLRRCHFLLQHRPPSLKLRRTSNFLHHQTIFCGLSCQQVVFCKLRSEGVYPRTRPSEHSAARLEMMHENRKIKKPSTAVTIEGLNKISGVVLLSHTQICSTIAAGALNYRVREGNVCCFSAIDTRKNFQYFEFKKGSWREPPR